MSDNYKTSINKCPGCGYVMDIATPLDEGQEPSPGDCALCLKCACVMIYQDDMTLAKATEEEMKELKEDEENWRMTQSAINAINKYRIKLN